MDKKLNPLESVAREMAEHSDMERKDIEIALEGLLEHLNQRATAAIDVDEYSQEAAEAAAQYRVACEVIAMFGTQLIAFDDIEEAEMGGRGEPN